MQITFNLPGHNRTIGQSFYLTDAGKSFSPTWMIGDEVSVMMPVTREQAILLRSKVSGIGTTNGHGSDVTAHIPCRVARRLSAVAWTEVGNFQVVANGDLVLEPISKVAEELLLWICCGENPGW